MGQSSHMSEEETKQILIQQLLSAVEVLLCQHSLSEEDRVKRLEIAESIILFGDRAPKESTHGRD